MGQDFSGSVEETTIDDREAFVGHLQVQLRPRAAPGNGRGTPEVSERARGRSADGLLGENPPINEYRVAIILGGG
jgi:hypothetical protein